MADELRQGLWRVVLTDLFGNAISNLTRVASAKVLTVTRNRPALFSFAVPSDAPEVATKQADGFPMLAEVVRGVRAYRCEVQADGSFRYVLRFGGHVWQVEDAGSADVAKTTVSCYDPLMRANTIRVRRMIWDAANGRYKWTRGGVQDQTYVFDSLASIAGSSTAAALIDRANSIQWTGMASTSAATAPTFDKHSPTIALADQAYATHFENVMTTDMIVQLAGLAGSFDFQCIPDESSIVLPTTGATVKQFGYLGLFVPGQGSLLSKLALGYATAPYNVSDVSAIFDGQNLSNDLLALGNTITASKAVPASKTLYQGTFESIAQFSDVSVQTELNGLASAEVSVSAQASKTAELTIQPAEASSVLPYDHFNIGDTLVVNAGAKLRGGFTGLQLRVEQYTLTIDDDKGESVSISTTPPS